MKFASIAALAMSLASGQVRKKGGCEVVITGFADDECKSTLSGDPMDNQNKYVFAEECELYNEKRDSLLIEYDDWDA